MNVEQKREGSAPVQGELKPTQFFTEGGCAVALADIEDALRVQVGIITLIGNEGSGKSVLCKMVEKRCGSPTKTVFLPRALKSFEDIVRMVARECDLENLAETDGADTKKIFMDLVAALRIRGESLLLICDEAEKMYLATFERIRKALDEINRQGGGLQLLFAGRKRLSGYFEQLHLCNFGEVDERQVVLSDYDGKEVLSYLNFHMRNLGEDGQQVLFTREAADRIASMAGGNLRMVNDVAGGALQAARADISSLVLLKHVKGDDPIKTSRPVTSDILQRFTFLKQLPFPPVYAMGGAAAVLLLLFLLSTGGEEENLAGDEQREKERVVSTPPVPVAKKGGEEGHVSSSGRLKKQKVKDASAAAPGKQEPEERVSSGEGSEKEEAVEVSKEESSSGKPVRNLDAEAADELAPASIPASFPPLQTPVEISPVEIVERGNSGPVIPALTGRSKVTLAGTTHIRADSVKQITARSGSGSVPGGESILAPLLAGGEKWQAGTNSDGFTIQLMALASEQSEENLKRILSQPDYQKIADKLVMLKHPSDPPVLLLFYGLYPSMAAARNARNNMPIFLRKHQPYAISVKRAVEKGRME